ncbi:MAG: NADH-quinone oxidoreductase subunit C [Actinomycetota bacterium]
MATKHGSLRSSERVEPEAFSERVRSSLREAAGEVSVRHGQVVAEPAPERHHEVMRALRDDPGLDCAFFTFLSAVDWQEEGFEVVTAVFSLLYRNTVIVKVRLPAEHPHLASISDLYGGANWHERNCAEMFGITFDGHPNLVKLYLPEDFEGFPLRKSFKLASRSYKDWPGAKDPAEKESGGR